MPPPDSPSRCYVYEKVSQIILRRGGANVRQAVECTVIRTRALVQDRPDGTFFVALPLITAGYYELVMAEWQDDWVYDTDNLSPDRQTGRPVDAAVPDETLPLLLHSAGRLPPGRTHPDVTGSLEGSFLTPVSALLVNGMWVEPLYYFGPVDGPHAGI